MTTAAIPADIVIHHILPRLPCDDFNWLYARSDASWRRGFMMPSCAFRKDVHYDVVSHVLRHEAHADAKAFVRAVGYRCVHDAKNIAVWIGALGSNDVRTVALMMRECSAFFAPAVTRVEHYLSVCQSQKIGSKSSPAWWEGGIHGVT